MYLSVHSVVLSCHLFLSPFTLCHSKWVSILVPDYEIMEVLLKGQNFAIFFIINSLWFCLSWNPIQWNDLLNQDLQHLWCSKPSVICSRLTALSQFFNIDIQCPHESLHISNASQHIGKLSTLQHIINLITIQLTLTPTSFLKETCFYQVLLY